MTADAHPIDISTEIIAARSPVSSEGLEEFFDTSAELACGLTIKQAVHFYGISARLIKAKIALHEIPAARLDVDGKRKWRVFPDGVPEGFKQFQAPLKETIGKETKESDLPTGSVPDEDPDLLPPWVQLSEIVEVIIEPDQIIPVDAVSPPPQSAQEIYLSQRIYELESRLEAATHRNGYLESQVDLLQEKVKCLTTTKPPKPWWSSLLGLLTGATA